LTGLERLARVDRGVDRVSRWALLIAGVYAVAVLLVLCVLLALAHAYTVPLMWAPPPPTARVERTRIYFQRLGHPTQRLVELPGTVLTWQHETAELGEVCYYATFVGGGQESPRSAPTCVALVALRGWCVLVQWVPTPVVRLCGEVWQ
jgi:hypothetical protein